MTSARPLTTTLQPLRLDQLRWSTSNATSLPSIESAEPAVGRGAEMDRVAVDSEVHRVDLRTLRCRKGDPADPAVGGCALRTRRGRVLVGW